MQVVQVKTMDHRNKTTVIYKGTFIHSEKIGKQDLDEECRMLCETLAEGILLKVLHVQHLKWALRNLYNFPV